MKTMILYLGDNSEYLGYIILDNKDVDDHCNALTPLIVANIKKELPLRRRMALLPSNIKYFPFAGALTELEYIKLPKT
jgi:hypothetical protein